MEFAYDAIVGECGRVLRAVYGRRLAGVVLYGSYARGDDDEESDVDLLVLLDGDFDLFEEIERVVDALYSVELEFGRCICAQPVRVEDYRRRTIQLYRNAAREGVMI